MTRPQQQSSFHFVLAINLCLITTTISGLLQAAEPPPDQEKGIENVSLTNSPNIVFVMTDDQGYWDTGVSGNPDIETPSMDRIAAEGIQLRRYYAAPVCAPTRAGIMTGRHYLRTGLYNTRFGGDTMGIGEVTVAQLLKQADYRTGLFGKWHLGKYPGYQPQDRGFDEFFGHYHGHIERYEFPDQLHHNGTPVKTRGYVSELFTDAAKDFIDVSHESGKPFFCALMFNAPHSPWVLDTSHYGQPEGDQTLTKYLEKGLPIREARIYSLIDRVDQNVGRLLQHLEQLGIADNTLIVFTSDNGGVSKHWKGGMNGNKASTYEGGVRAPCFVRWPNRIAPGQVSNALTSHIDWLPTFCEVADIKPPSDRTIDGKSLVQLMSENPSDSHHEYVYHTWDRYSPNPDRRWGISDERWKLMCVVGNEASATKKNWRLFDLKNDPEEKKNLREQEPQTVNRLRSAFTDWFTDVTQGIEYRPIRIPISTNPKVVTELSPSWATWQGDHIQYTFDGYDWDTIDSWKERGESATWRLEIERSGKYKIQLSYGCSPQNAGGILNLQAGQRRLAHRVQATATAEQFGQFEAGTIWLEEGEHDFTASVAESRSNELMRLNSITLQPISN